MPTFNTPAIQAFGLIDDGSSPATRAFVPDVGTSVTEASFREGMSNDEDAGANGFIAGMMSTYAFGGPDLDDKGQAETYASNYTAVKMVAVTPDLIIQWVNSQRLMTDQDVDVSQVNLEQGEYMMTREGGALQSHDVYVGRNGLLYLAPENGGWADTDSSGVADGYSTTNTNSEAFSSGVQELFVDTGTTGSLSVTIPFPIDNVTVTLSTEITQVHDDGSQTIRIEALDASQNLISNAFTSKSVSATGRTFADLTTPSGTYYLKCYPVRVSDPTVNNAKAKLKNPALRLNGATSYVQR